MTENPIDTFVNGWTDDPQVREAFIQLRTILEEKSGVTLEFISREGVSHSLRAVRQGQIRPIFALVDIIEDTPRWLSVCFYEDTIDDPDGMGNLVPSGILGEDGYCFDVEGYDEGQLAYLEIRIDEAYASAVGF